MLWRDCPSNLLTLILQFYLSESEQAYVIDYATVQFWREVLSLSTMEIALVIIFCINLGHLVYNDTPGLEIATDLVAYAPEISSMRP